MERKSYRIGSQKWTAVPKKLYLIEDFLNQWSSTFAQSETIDVVLLLNGKKLVKSKLDPSHLNRLSEDEYDEFSEIDRIDSEGNPKPTGKKYRIKRKNML
jgi:hypothetical protein